RWAAADETALLPRFADVVGHACSAGPAQMSMADQIRGAAAEERPNLITGVLAEAAAAVLGIPAARLDCTRPLTEYGLDSLMSVELNMRVRRDLGVEVPTMAFLRGETLARLGIELAPLFGPATSAPAVSAVRQQSPTDQID